MNVLPGLIAVGAALFAQSPPAPPAQTGAPPSAQSDPSAAQAATYCVRFGRGLEALDRGEHAAAARAFLNAGKLAHDAPVWRVHAGVALARAGDEEAATALFRAALDAGYPPSDLAALGRIGATTAAAWAADGSPVRHSALDVARSGWRSVTARGLVGPNALRADVRHARFRPPAIAHLGGITHVVGTPQAEYRSTFEHFRVDPRASTVTPVPRDKASLTRSADDLASRGYSNLVFVDAPSPWPRGAPLVRALRSGFLIDVPMVRVEHEIFRLVSVSTSDGRRSVVAQTDSDRSRYRPIYQSIDLDRLTLRPASSADRIPAAPRPLEEVTDATLRERAWTLLGRTVRLWRMSDDAPLGPGALLATRGRQAHTDFAAVHEPLLLLDEDAQKILHEFDFSAARAAEGLTKGDLYCGTPAIDLGAQRLVVSLSVGTVEAFDTTDGAFVWRASLHPKSGRGTREVSFSSEHLVVTSQGDDSVAELRRATDGALVTDGASLGLIRLRGSEDGSLLVGQGLDALFVLGGRAVRDDAGALTSEPRLALWLLSSTEGRDVVSVASDGAWQAPAHALPRARVLLDDAFVPAESLAPWLFDPLHVRTALDDADPSPRRFPWPQGLPGDK